MEAEDAPDHPAAFDPKAPFTPKEARAHGISRDELLTGPYHRIMHGLYVSSSVPITFELRARAVLESVADDSHLSHFSAARWWGLWVPDDPDLHICRARKSLHSRDGVRAHTCTMHGDDRARGAVLTRKGISVTSPVGCFFELASCLNLVDLVILGDSLVARRKTTRTALIDRANRYIGPGARRARVAAALVRTGVDSRMETRLRLLLVLAGFPEPSVNVKLRDAEGEVRRRLDLAYQSLKVAVEYDGEQHRETSEAWNDDIIRRDEVGRAGWDFVVVTRFGIYRDPGQTIDRVESAMRKAGWSGRRRPKQSWRRHFPGRTRTS